MNREESTLVASHMPCEACGSSDALSLYTDGHSYCFSCGAISHRGDNRYNESVFNKGRQGANNSMQQIIEHGSLRYLPLPKRGISQEACVKFGVGIHTDAHSGEHSLVFPYYNISESTSVIAQKIRTPDKQFRTLGAFSVAISLFGAQLWRNNGGRRLVITEGELDCLAVAQSFNLSWATCSIRNGAQGASRDIKNNLEFIESFSEVVLWFDNDAPGRRASEECSKLISPGKCKIVHLDQSSGYKDANDILMDKGIGAISIIQRYVYEAKVMRPDGIVVGTEVYDRLKRYRDSPISAIGYPITCLPKLNEMLRGIRKGKLYTLIAAPKVGKSTVAKEICYELLMTSNLKIATLAIEESIEETSLLLMGLYLRKQIHVNPKETCTDEEFDRAYSEVIGNERLFMFDHFGSLDPESLMSRFRYFAVSLGVDVILFDHVSIVVSGLANGANNSNDTKTIGLIETKLRSLIQETGVSVIQIAHIRKGQGSKEDAELGGRVSASDVLGSGDIGRISDFLIALEGDVSGKDNTRRVRVLLNRLTGKSGLADFYTLNEATGRIEAITSRVDTNSEGDTTSQCLF